MSRNVLLIFIVAMLAIGGARATVNGSVVMNNPSEEKSEKKQYGKKKDKSEPYRVGGANLSFEESEYDFGEIEERGKKVSHEYTFTNRGDKPLVLTRSIESCRCINVNFSKRPVAPGEQGVVTVTYNPRKQQGMFYKAIQIYSNAAERVHIIVVKGFVVVDH